MAWAQQFRAFKPHEATYLGAAGLLGVEPAEILMVASHCYDLDAAAELGLGTAFVYRPDEYGRAATRTRHRPATTTSSWNRSRSSPGRSTPEPYLALLVLALDDEVRAADGAPWRSDH